MSEVRNNTRQFSGSLQKIEHFLNLKYSKDESEAAAIRRRLRLRQMCFSSTRLKRRLSFLRLTEGRTLDFMSFKTSSPRPSTENPENPLQRRRESSSLDKNNQVFQPNVQGTITKEREKQEKRREQNPVHGTDNLTASETPGIDLDTPETKQTHTAIHDQSDPIFPTIVFGTVRRQLRGLFFRRLQT